MGLVRRVRLQGDDVAFLAKMLNGCFIIYQDNDAIALFCRWLPPDEYKITIKDPSGDVILEKGGIISGGNFQIHPSNAGHPYPTP